MNVALKYDGLATRDMIREAAEAEQNYQKTGKHITLEEHHRGARQRPGGALGAGAGGGVPVRAGAPVHPQALPGIGHSGVLNGAFALEKRAPGAFPASPGGVFRPCTVCRA